MQDDTLLTVDERQYVNPQTGLSEANQFIETLRDVQAQNTAEINQNTYNLGSKVPSNVGGLTGSEGLWQAQYQTPQTDAQIANLRAVAQQQALNQATQNLQSVYQNQYKQALRNYYARRKAESDAAKASAQTSSTSTQLGIDTETPTPAGDLVIETAPMSVPENQLNENALDRLVQGSANSGNPNTAGSQGLTYTDKGTTYYVNLYRNNLGNVTGGALYTAQGGQLTPIASHTQSGITNLLNNLGKSGVKIYDSAGSDVTGQWSLI